MKRWLIILTTTAVLAAALVLWLSSRAGAGSTGPYVFTEIVRTDLSATVSSTGTLSAVEAIDVGTQVSGQVKEVLVDYNEYVEAGQLLAVIDTEMLDASVQDAQARVVQAEAQRTQAEAQIAEAEANLADARAKLERNAPLAEKGYLSESELQPLQTSVQTAAAAVERLQAALISSEAQVTQSRAQLTQTLKDRSNAEIRAPIDGIVVERTVDAGQTVAASFETPTLFILARNLAQMQILADVDESDIGQIQKGQEVTFSVPAYPGSTYHGTVREVRLQPSVAQNVVTYTVVIDAENRDTTLLPGMTTTVDFVTGSAQDVLAVSSAALQVQMSPDMVQRNGPDRSSDAPRTITPRLGGDGAQAAQLWYVNDAGKPSSVTVRTGLTTNAMTEIAPVDGEGESVLQPGLQVIGQILATGEATTVTSRQGGRPRI